MLQAGDLCDLLNMVTLNDQDDDRVWDENKQIFLANTVLKLLINKRWVSVTSVVVDFPYDLVWNSLFVPPKVDFFVWTLIRGRVLTVDNLKKRGIFCVNRCTVYGVEEETVHHLFVDCRISESIWDFFGLSFHAAFLSVQSIMERLNTKPNRALSKLGMRYWDSRFHAFCWGIWKERNNRVFEGKSRNLQQILGNIKQLIWDWNIFSVEGIEIRQENVMFNWSNLLLQMTFLYGHALYLFSYEFVLGFP